MSDITFCELCGGEAKNDIIEMRGRTIKVCPSCASEYTTQIDKACSNTWDAEIAKIKATKTVDVNKKAVIQSKIDTLNSQLSAINIVVKQ